MNWLNKQSVRQIASTVVIVVVAYFFYIALEENWHKVQDIDFSVNIWSVLAVLLFALAVIVSGILWGKMLNSLATNDNLKVSAKESIRVHINSWLLKYIPGQAGSAINKVAWAKSHKFSKKQVLITFIYENLYLLIGSFAISVPVLLFILGGDVFADNLFYIVAPLVTLVVAGVFISRKNMHRVINLIFTKIIKQPVPQDFFLTNLESVKLQLWYLVPRIINGFGFVLVTASVLPVEVSDYLPLIAIYTFAGAVGILAIFVPSGLGVREAVIVLFASQIMSLEQAIIVSILARLYSTVADGVLALIYVVYKLESKREGVKL